MKILGIGIDIVKNNRIKILMKNQSFIKRTFGKNEIMLANKNKNKVNYFAKRFASKEAFAKSIGTGFRDNLNLIDIEILNNKVGKPYYLKTIKLDRIIKKKFKVKNYNILLSISDEKDYSIAITILQGI